MKKIVILFIGTVIALPALAEQSGIYTAGVYDSEPNIAKKDDGSLKYMTQSEAIDYCSDQGMHLPSAREITQFAMSSGAKGIVDSCDSSEQKCYKIDEWTVDGTSDSFNFSYAGYQRPSGDSGDAWFWSSSIPSKYSSYGLFLRGNDGVVSSVGRKITLAVRCVSDR